MLCANDCSFQLNYPVMDVDLVFYQQERYSCFGSSVLCKLWWLFTSVGSILTLILCLDEGEGMVPELTCGCGCCQLASVYFC